MLIRIILVGLLAATPAIAQQQQQPDLAFLQRAIAALQVQRNQALDNEVAWRAQHDGVAEQLAKAQARIRELEAQSKAPAELPQP